MPESHVDAVVAALAAPVTETPEKPNDATPGTGAPAPAAAPVEVKTTDKGVDANVPDPTKPEPKKDEKPAVASKPEGEKKDEQPVDEDDPYGLTAELRANPKVEALTKTADEYQKFKDLLVEGYSIPLEDQQGKPLPVDQVMASLRLERADAHALYDIINGRQPVDKLLGMLIDPNLKYPREVAENVYSQTVDYLAKVGFLSAYISANGLKLVKAEAEGAPVDPAKPNTSDDARFKALETRLQQQTAAEEQRIKNEAAQQVANQRQTVEKSFVDKISELATKKGIDASLLNNYIKGVSDQVNGQPAVLQRIAKGNWVDVNRYFTTYHNLMLEQARKYGQQIATTKASIQNKVPNSPAGGSAPAAATVPTKRSFAKQEDRVSAVADMLKE